MKRLLCLVSSMNSGGAETFLMKLYRNFDRSKYQMDFCVNVAEEGFYDHEILNMGGKIYHIPSKSENLREFKKQLTDVVRSNGYEYVLRITSNTMGFMDLKIAKKAGARVCAARSSNSNDAEGFKAKIVHFIGGLFYRHYVDVKIAPSDLAAIYTFGEKAYRDGKVYILKNAVDLDIYKYSTEAREEIRREFKIDSNTIVYGHIGRFSKQKNHRFLIDVFAEICKREKNAKLMLVGNGEFENQIKELCTQKNVLENVIFTGVRTDIPALLSAMDAFIFPSLYEGMPNTVIEAQATGLPCVISDTITSEANITGHVEYLSLDAGCNCWAQTAIEKAKVGRYEAYDRFIKEKYDIKSSVDLFIKCIFAD